MLSKLYLKRFIKFRLEDDFVLLCNCSNIECYEFPISSLDLLHSLENQGVLICDLTAEDKLVLEDLQTLDFLDNEPNSNKGFNDNKWASLDYTESEFYKQL